MPILLGYSKVVFWGCWVAKSFFAVSRWLNVLCQEYTAFRRRRNALLRERRNQILLAFSFWPEIKPRSGKHIYELRSYTLKVQ